MQAPAREVHHIAGRNAAARDSIAQKYEDKKNWLAVCRVCHSAVDKETPAVTACAAKLLAGELDLRYLQDLRPGKRFAVSLGDLAQACDNLKEWIDVKKLRGKM
jgi:cytochrome c553